MIEPTIGRDVLIYRPEATGGEYEPGKINSITGNGKICVMCFTRDKGPIQLNHIPLYQTDVGAKHPGDGEVNHTFACWMPYQLRNVKGHQSDPFFGRDF